MNIIPTPGGQVLTAPAHGDLPPLVVDLDGTLTATDTLVESVLGILKNNPLALFALLLVLLSGRGRSGFKQWVAARATLEAEHLPWRQDFLDWLRAERARGRRLILATAAHESIAHAVASHLGLFDQVLATSGALNLKGRHKLEAIQASVGARFSYAGDSRADLAVWSAAAGAVLVGASSGVARAARAIAPIEKSFDYPRPSVQLWLRAMRVHQWVKNLLLFVPIGAAFEFGDGAKVLSVLLGFVAFSLVASATYIFNDLWDLASDRQHPRKRARAFASGRIALLHGVAMAGALCAGGFALGVAAMPLFGAVLAGYVVLTTAYSWALKERVLIDVLMLAMLYTYRVLAGALVTDIEVTPWLLAFSIFTFFSLALVKRCAELVSLRQLGKQAAHGRDYEVGDLVVLWPLGVGASLCSVVVFGLYIGSPGAAEHYANIHLLWLVGVVLLYWHARLWIKTVRGQMHDDPLVFALRDRGSCNTIGAMLVLTGLAHFLA